MWKLSLKRKTKTPRTASVAAKDGVHRRLRKKNTGRETSQVYLSRPIVQLWHAIWRFTSRSHKCPRPFFFWTTHSIISTEVSLQHSDITSPFNTSGVGLIRIRRSLRPPLSSHFSLTLTLARIDVVVRVEEPVSYASRFTSLNFFSSLTDSEPTLAYWTEVWHSKSAHTRSLARSNLNASEVWIILILTIPITCRRKIKAIKPIHPSVTSKRKLQFLYVKNTGRYCGASTTYPQSGRSSDSPSTPTYSQKKEKQGNRTKQKTNIVYSRYIWISGDKRSQTDASYEVLCRSPFGTHGKCRASTTSRKPDMPDR